MLENETLIPEWWWELTTDLCKNVTVLTTDQYWKLFLIYQMTLSFDLSEQLTCINNRPLLIIYGLHFLR